MAWTAMRSSLWAGVACLLAFSAVDVSAVARPADAQAKALAKKHNASARSLFHQGRFEQAALEYEKAYQAVPVPEFLHNLGRCHQRLEGAEHARRALFYLDSYVKAAPNAPNRAEVEAAMVELRTRLKPPPAPPPKPRPQPAVQALPLQPDGAPAPRVRRSTPVYQRWWFWTVVGVVVAGAATTAAVVATRPREAAPAMGTMPPGQVQLELRGGR
jgi:hypothetical protein